MSEFVRVILALGLLPLANCAGRNGPPALVLEVLHITRRLATEGSSERRREVAFSASVALPLDSVPSPPPSAAAFSCEPPEAAWCGWVQAEEQAAWIAALEQPESSP